MSAPDTKLEKQKKRHWPVFAGIVVAVLVAIVAVLALSPADEAVEAVVETTN